MANDVLSWDIYEISAKETELHGVKFRGRIRKFGLVNSINILAENTEDEEGKVRFAVLSGSDVTSIREFLKKLVPDVVVELKRADVRNPVLSKMKVNIESRYEL